MDRSKMANSYRTIFISDVHLGTRGCKAKFLADFLKFNDCENLFLVGDIIDGWRMKQGIYWPQEHSNVVRRVLTKAKRGTKITWIAGNHDEFLRKFLDYKIKLGNIDLADEYIYTTLDGREFLIIHGDSFDGIVKYHKWLAYLGDHAYSLLLHLNTVFNFIRHKFGLNYWSLSSYLKQKAKQALNFIYEFENAVAHECHRRGFDGVVCGHIHHAEMKQIGGILYCNDGDWVESCTALVEHFDGSLEIVKWDKVTNEDTSSN